MTFIGCLTHTTHEPNCRAQCLRSCISRLGRSWANSRRCSGIPRIDLATIRPCPRNHDNIVTQLNDQYARLRLAAFPTNKSKSDTTGRAHDAISSSMLCRFAWNFSRSQGLVNGDRGNEHNSAKLIICHQGMSNNNCSQRHDS